MKRITTLNETDFIVLSALLEEPIHGYDLMHQHPDLSRSQTYHALSKLHRHGLLEKRIEEAEDAPARQVYSIPARQRQRIHRLLQESMDQVSAKAQKSLRDYYASHDSASKLQEVAIRLLRASGNQFHRLSE